MKVFVDFYQNVECTAVGMAPSANTLKLSPTVHLDEAGGRALVWVADIADLDRLRAEKHIHMAQAAEGLDIMAKDLETGNSLIIDDAYAVVVLPPHEPEVTSNKSLANLDW